MLFASLRIPVYGFSTLSIATIHSAVLSFHGFHYPRTFIIERDATEDCAVEGLTLTFTKQALEQQPQSRIKYSYIPLQSPSSFRTLTVKHSQYKSDTECSLHEGYPGDGTVYYTLSYIWGPPIFPHLIYCDGGILSIIASLFSALQNYRQVDNSVRMWADAICIDQDNMEERFQQVLLMQEIYSKVHRCISGWEKIRSFAVKP